jgi:hypothetical protein
MPNTCPECGVQLDANGLHPYHRLGSTCGRAPLYMPGKTLVGDCPQHGPYYARSGEVVTSCPNCAAGRPSFKGEASYQSKGSSPSSSFGAYFGYAVIGGILGAIFGGGTGFIIGALIGIGVCAFIIHR